MKNLPYLMNSTTYNSVLLDFVLLFSLIFLWSRISIFFFVIWYFHFEILYFFLFLFLIFAIFFFFFLNSSSLCGRRFGRLAVLCNFGPIVASGECGDHNRQNNASWPRNQTQSVRNHPAITLKNPKKPPKSPKTQSYRASRNLKAF